MFDSLLPIKGFASTPFAVRGFKGRAVSSLWKRPANRLSDTCARNVFRLKVENIPIKK